MDRRETIAVFPPSNPSVQSLRAIGRCTACAAGRAAGRRHLEECRPGSKSADPVRAPHPSRAPRRTAGLAPRDVVVDRCRCCESLVQERTRARELKKPARRVPAGAIRPIAFRQLSHLPIRVKPCCRPTIEDERLGTALLGSQVMQPNGLNSIALILFDIFVLRSLWALGRVLINRDSSAIAG